MILVETIMAGVGKLDARVTVDNRPVSVKCMEREHGFYRISLLPSQPSRHWLYITFNKDSVPGELLLHSIYQKECTRLIIITLRLSKIVCQVNYYYITVIKDSVPGKLLLRII